jgi:hypothetical protein
MDRQILENRRWGEFTTYMSIQGIPIDIISDFKEFFDKVYRMGFADGEANATKIESDLGEFDGFPI